MIEAKTLQDLPLNRQIPAEIISVAVDKLEKDGETTYLFDSASYAYPHRLVVSTSGQLLERSIYLSKSDQEFYNNMLSQLGEPDAKVVMTEHTTRQIFLKQGLIFLSDDEGNISTVTSASQERISKITGFLQKIEAEPREASSVAVPTKTKIQQALLGEKVTHVTGVQPTQSLNGSVVELAEGSSDSPNSVEFSRNMGNLSNIWIVVGIGIALLGMVLVLLLKRNKKTKASQSTTTTITVPPPQDPSFTESQTTQPPESGLSSLPNIPSVNAPTMSDPPFPINQAPTSEPPSPSA